MLIQGSQIKAFYRTRVSSKTLFSLAAWLAKCWILIKRTTAWCVHLNLHICISQDILNFQMPLTIAASLADVPKEVTQDIACIWNFKCSYAYRMVTPTDYLMLKLAKSRRNHMSEQSLQAVLQWASQKKKIFETRKSTTQLITSVTKSIFYENQWILYFFYLQNVSTLLVPTQTCICKTCHWT